MAAIHLKFTLQQSVRLFLRTALPYKDFAYFRRYLLTVQQVTVQKDSRTVSLYRLYGCLLAYFSCLNLAHFLLPHSHFLRVLAGDDVATLAMDRKFNLAFACLAAYSVYLSWVKYFRVNPQVYRFYQDVIQEAEEGGSRSSSGSSILGPRAALFRQLSLLAINLLQTFILLLDVIIAIFAPIAVTHFTCLTFDTFSSLADYNSALFWALFWLLLLPVYLFHLSLNLVLWYTFAHGLILFGTNGILIITALYFLFAQNYRHLKRALAQLARRTGQIGKPSWNSKTKRTSVGSLAYRTRLLALLRRNAAHFRLIFAFDGYYGRPYVVFLGLHVPTSAYFSVQLLLRPADLSSFSLLVMVGLVGEAFIGTLCLHLYVAHFTSFLHRSGKWLLAFSASTLATTQSGSVLISRRERLLLWIHINRLVVKKRYGFTYAGKTWLAES